MPNGEAEPIGTLLTLFMTCVDNGLIMWFHLVMPGALNLVSKKGIVSGRP